MKVQVAVVGAGPVGLTAALALKAQGITPVIFEADAEDKLRPGSRALFIHNQPLQELDQMAPGMRQTLIDQGLVWDARRYFYRGRQFFVKEYDERKRQIFGTSVPQAVTEAALRDACRAAGIETYWSAPVAGVHVDDHGVEIAFEGRDSVMADFVVGADGSKSVVRKTAGIKLIGNTSDSRWVIIDLDELDEEPARKELTFHYAHPGVGQRNVLMIPFKGGWRLDIEARNDEELRRLSTPEEIRAWLPSVMDARYCDKIAWVSTYRFYQLVAEHFTDTHRRVLLVGEAAHLFPPFGGRGLNSGIIDAASAAHAIAQSIASPGLEQRKILVDAFSRDRRAAADFNMESAAIGVDLMAPATILGRLKREWLALRSRWSIGAARALSMGPNGRAGGRPGQSGIY
ncbi:hypothetical protein BSL82_04395 [Tardibacter chloracetimidivorans]|uniref:FAD-binding domain-containing protein n=1 Tax=Tardibacter chloracetimidivorans TaxID=1921510 RepID=A0A1L3ZSP1_9SPHN|nr:FAD-dependent monooxygenase [Tardibacter chloracetimidivorans]API58644.1 hypothetical protein BSL82_04395 [Tardibacter chloracetimidivorans]